MQNRYVRVLIKNQSNQYLLMYEKDPFDCGRDRCNFPGGRVEQNQTPIEAAIREVLEECNLTIDKKQLHLLLCDRSVTKGMVWLGYYFVANVKNTENLKIMEPNKCFKMEWSPRHEIADKYKSNLYGPKEKAMLMRELGFAGR